MLGVAAIPPLEGIPVMSKVSYSDRPGLARPMVMTVTVQVDDEAQGYAHELLDRAFAHGTAVTIRLAPARPREGGPHHE